MSSLLPVRKNQVHVATSWDLFFSYRRHDFERAQPLITALERAGVSVWRDEKAIPDQASITAEIRQGIANSKVFLAFYSCTYPLSNACQQEITMAWLAAQQIGQAANRRVWIVNPEEGLEHLPQLFRDQQVVLQADDASQTSAIEKAVNDRLAALGFTLLGSGVRDLPRYHGITPIQADRFVGRAQEFWELHGKLTANRISIITGTYGQSAVQVRGLGGNGKSLLAREYGVRFGPAYPGGVFWLNAYGHDDTNGSINAEQRETLRQVQVRSFAIDLQVPIEGHKPEEVESRFWAAIEQRAAPCLWIVDDLPSGVEVSDLQRRWYARWPHASILITTRSKEYGSLGEKLDLGTLSSYEAFSLLRSHRQLKTDAERNTACRIVELLGNHPLAIEVAGSYLGMAGEDFENYLMVLADPSQDAVEFGNSLKESLPTGHERSISATLLKSIRQLGPEGLDFLRIASVLAVAPISFSLLREVFEVADANGTAWTRSVKAVGDVEALCLCERFDDHSRTVHTLVSRTMKFQFPAEERTRELRLAAVLAIIRRLAGVAHAGEMSKVAVDIPHARHLIKDDLPTLDEARLAADVAAFDFERGQYNSARLLEQQVLASIRRVLGEEHPKTLTAMLNLAGTLYAQGDYAGARQLQEQVLAVCRQMLGGEHPDTLAAMNNLAGTLYAQGDYTGAQQLQEQVLAASNRVRGGEHSDTLTAMNNLAETLKAQGDYAGAQVLQEQVLTASRRVLGKEHPNTLTAMNNLAETLKAQGDYAGARHLQERALTAIRRVLGKEHPHTLATMLNLAGTLHAQGDYTGARQLEEQALAANRRVLGEEHPNTLTAMNNLAETLKAQGDYAGARHLQEQALAAIRRVLGEEHPQTLTAMVNLVGTLYAQGDLAASLQLYQQMKAAPRRALR